MKYVYKEISENVNVSKHHPVKYLFSRLFVILVIVCFVYFILCGALEIAIRYMPDKLESVLSTSFHSFSKSVDGYDSKSQQRLDRILSELLVHYPDKDKRFQIYLIKEDQVNALALPGNNIVVFSGLIEKLDNDKEVAFVVGHEMGHYVNHDHLRGLGQGAIFMAIIASLGGNDPGGTISKSVGLFGLRYSRKQENSADLFSVGLLQKCYGSGQGAISAIEKLGLYGKKQGLEISSTHPLTKRRIANIKEYLLK
ncbi:MAG: M48 family metallopeptidase [Candidatus Omnitrophota bacterium]